jgi:hypothetical protein
MQLPHLKTPNSPPPVRFFSLSLPPWASAPRAPRRAPRTRWTCAKCGDVVHSRAEVERHLARHAAREREAVASAVGYGRTRRPLRILRRRRGRPTPRHRLAVRAPERR